MPKLTAPLIVELLQAPTEDRRPVKWQIARTASTNELLGALQIAPTPLLRCILCELLGKRCAVEAVPTLIDLLYDADAGTRSEAAFALGRIGDSRAGPALLERFTNTDGAHWERHGPAAGLGSVGYRPAIPALIAALDDPDPVLRSGAAWSLGILGAVEAQQRLQAAYAVETERSAGANIKDALVALQVVAFAFGTADQPRIEARLTRALSSRMNTVRGAAAWAIGELKVRNMVPVLEQRLKREKACFVAARMREALNLLEPTIL
jgi:HEAT repeat protein